MSRKAWGTMDLRISKHSVWTGVECALVQILVVVASIQVRLLKTEVEKGSEGTAFGLRLVVPKR